MCASPGAWGQEQGAHLESTRAKCRMHFLPGPAVCCQACVPWPTTLLGSRGVRMHVQGHWWEGGLCCGQLWVVGCWAKEAGDRIHRHAVVLTCPLPLVTTWGRVESPS
eukprot:9857823-Alexandrium_andersonii.AAC.2